MVVHTSKIPVAQEAEVGNQKFKTNLSYLGKLWVIQRDPVSEESIKKRAGSVAQWLSDPGFNPCLKKKKKKELGH